MRVVPPDLGSQSVNRRNDASGSLEVPHCDEVQSRQDATEAGGQSTTTCRDIQSRGTRFLASRVLSPTGRPVSTPDCPASWSRHGVGAMQCVTPRQTYPRPNGFGLQLTFKDSMVHRILQFTPSITFHYVLHRCESRDILLLRVVLFLLKTSLPPSCAPANGASVARALL
ncbi:hypothetical protein F0562_028841 [Nyssa sinensis]|uniref:Uncharacterized protein n=1 Tax=Nyssa sinensis TaxID=561372 RepID=A0A5J5AZ98_9ASTE|nr:hypothetical protein F0562_028841 [Nyssa sinensis]